MENGQGQEARQFQSLTGIIIDDKNHIFVADSFNSCKQVFPCPADKR